MKDIIKNIFLIVALGAVIIMVIGILLYDYIPTSTTVAEPNTYTASAETTKVLEEIASTSLSTTTDNSSSSTATSSISLKTYEITETDLALYSAKNLYDAGKSDPFDSIDSSSGETSDGSDSSESGSSSTSGTTSSASSSTSTTNSSNTTTSTSDGTLFNSTSSK